MAISVDDAIGRIQRKRGRFVEKEPIVDALSALATDGGGGTATFYNALDYAVDNTGGTVLTAAQNRTAINAVIDLASAAGGGVVYLPVGVYLVTGTGTASAGAILLKDNVTLMGDGIGLTIIRCADTVNDKLSGIVRTPSGVENDNIRVQDLTIDAYVQTGTGDVTCFYAGVTPANRTLFDTNITCLRVECTRGYNGADSAGYGFDPHEMCDNISFIDCVARSNDQDGFVLDGCVNFLLSGCRSYENGRHGYNFVTESYNGQVIGCTGRYNIANNLIVQNDSHTISVLGGLFSNNEGGANIRIRGNGTIVDTRVVIQGARIVTSATYGVSITGANYNLINANYFVDSGQASAGAYDDVNIDVDGAATSNYNVVSLNFMALLNGAVRYAVREEASGGDDNSAILNRVDGNQNNSPAISMAGGTNSFIFDNVNSDFFFGRTTTGRMTLKNGGRFRFGSANVQATVGAAGAASALPATPSKYLRFEDSDGTQLVVPAYLQA